jgi:hypothetical protein
MISKMNKPLQLFLLMLSVAVLLAFIPQQADARKGNKSSGKARTSVNKNRNTNRNTNKNRNTNVNVNNNRNTNVNIDVDVDRRHRRHNNGGFVAGLATGLVIGAIVYSLPSGCTTLVRNGISYSQCGTTWYQPQYSGNNVTYIVVEAP